MATGSTAGLRVLFTAAAAASLLLTHVSARQAQPRFTAGVDLVPVDFVAITSDGHPVVDLTPEEVTLKIGGRARTIRSMQWIEVDDPLSTATPLRATFLPAPFGSNAATDAGRGIIIALEDESLTPGREAPLRSAMHRLLMSLGSRDRVALLTMPYGGLKVDFTREHDRVGQAFAQIGGQADRAETGRDAACRTRRTLEALVGLLDGLSSPDAPTTVVFITGGLAGPRRDAPPMLAPGVCELTTDQFRQVGVSAARARANFYIVQPEDPSISGALFSGNIAGVGYTGPDNPFEGIEHLSGVTGGRRLHLATKGPDTLLRIVRETAGYYLAAFEPEPRDRNGEKHEISLATSRAGITVRARPEIIIGRAANRGREGITPRGMLREARVHRDLPLRAIAYTSSSNQGKVKVVVLAEPVDPSVSFRSAMAGLFDQDGRLVAQATVDSTPGPGASVMTALEAAPGQYRLRVAATDSSGRAGSADYPLSAELAPAGTLQLSSVMLGLSRAGGFAPRMVFGREPVALAYLEVYGATPGTPVSIRVELAETVDGPAMLTIPGAVDATRNESRRVATAAIPLGALKPGDYVVRAVVQAEGQPAGRVIRTMRKALER